MPQNSTAPAVKQRSWKFGNRGTYLIIRVTGVLLAVLALGHFALTHIITDVAETGSAFIAERWSSAVWIIWDSLLLASAFLHAAAGLVAVIRDYQPESARRRRYITFMLVISGVLVVLGVVTLFVHGVR